MREWFERRDCSLSLKLTLSTFTWKQPSIFNQCVNDFDSDGVSINTTSNIHLCESSFKSSDDFLRKFLILGSFLLLFIAFEHWTKTNIIPIVFLASLIAEICKSLDWSVADSIWVISDFSASSRLSLQPNELKQYREIVVNSSSVRCEECKTRATNSRWAKGSFMWRRFWEGNK